MASAEQPESAARQAGIALSQLNAESSANLGVRWLDTALAPIARHPSRHDQPRPVEGWLVVDQPELPESEPNPLVL